MKRRLLCLLFCFTTLSSCNITSNDEGIVIDDITFQTCYYSDESISTFAKNVSINLRVKIDVNESSLKERVSYDDININYDKSKIEIIEKKNENYLNEFSYIITFKTNENIEVDFNIYDYSKSYTFNVSNDVNSSLYYRKQAIYPHVNTISVLNNKEEYDNYIKQFNFESYLKPNDLYFTNAFLLAIPFSYSSSESNINYVTSFIDNDNMYFNFTYKEGRYVTSDYNEDLYFIRLDNQYKDYNFKILKTNIEDE